MNNDGKDVSILTDAMFYLQNAVAIENHAIQSYTITGNKNYLDIAERTRKLRSKFLYSITPEKKGQIYCLSKHTMGCAMALKELANRFKEEGNENLYLETLNDASYFEEVFFMLNNEDKK